MEIIKCLEQSNIVKDFEVLTFETFEYGFYLKIKASLINNTELFIREFSDINERDYSYHWQDKNKNLIMRWDNAKHYIHLKTYPHHLHSENNILPNTKISCDEILKEISGYLV